MNQNEKATVGYNVAQRVGIYSHNENHPPYTALCHLKNRVIIIEKIMVEREVCQEMTGSRARPGKVPAGHLHRIAPTGVVWDALLTGNEGRSAVSDDPGFLESIEFLNSMKEVS
jgi:hypothetical protein